MTSARADLGTDKCNEPSQLGITELVTVGMDSRSDNGCHLAGAENSHLGHGAADDSRQDAGPTGVNGPYDPLSTGDSNRRAISGQDREGAPRTGRHRGIGPRTGGGAGVLDQCHPVTMNLAQPGPRQVDDRLPPGPDLCGHVVGIHTAVAHVAIAAISEDCLSPVLTDRDSDHAGLVTRSEPATSAGLLEERRDVEVVFAAAEVDVDASAGAGRRKEVTAVVVIQS